MARLWLPFLAVVLFVSGMEKPPAYVWWVMLKLPDGHIAWTNHPLHLKGSTCEYP
jgi:hypothetical protein